MKVFYFCAHGTRPSLDRGFGATFAWDVPLLEGYEYELLSDRNKTDGFEFWQMDNPSIGDRLEAYRPHALWVHGYGYRSCWRAARWARGRSAIVYFGDSELLRPRPLWKRVLKQVVVRYFFRQCDAIITIGDNNEAYYSRYGVGREKMYRGVCPIDLARFRAAVEAADRPSRAAIRARFGLPEQTTVVLFSGKMVAGKRPADLIDAITALRDRDVNVYALMVGDGPLRVLLEDKVRSSQMERYIRFTGFINQREIPLVLDCGDILAVTSEQDAHPLAVTESMAVGHAIVASDRIGCVGPTDTARPNVNAKVYPVGNVAALATAIQEIVEDPQLLARMRKASLELVRGQDVAVTAAAVLRAVGDLRSKYASEWADVPGEFFDSLPGIEKELSAGSRSMSAEDSE